MNVPSCSLLVGYIYWHIKDSCFFVTGALTIQEYVHLGAWSPSAAAPWWLP